MRCADKFPVALAVSASDTLNLVVVKRCVKTSLLLALGLSLMSCTPRPGTPATDLAATPTTTPPDLAALPIDDHPHRAGYDRDAFPTWLDPDHNGCDARSDALRSAGQNITATGCKITGGLWTSAYDDTTILNPSTIDIDHIVPLANAWASGAWSWTTDQRAAYANDPTVLWPVSATSNRSKGDRSPDQWRPPSHTIWCTYARRWTSTKLTYRLTITTAERDALGQMLGTC